MSDRSMPDWNLRDSDVLGDQRRAYDLMRERCPVAYSDFLGWSLFRHDDVAAVLADPATFSSASRHRAVPNGMDPPEHTRYRRALAPFFASERMASFEPECRRVAAAQAAALRESGEADFVAEFADPFSLRAHCAFLGWPDEWLDSLRGWTHGNMEASLSRDRAAGRALAAEFAGYVQQALRTRREAGAAPDADVTAALMATEVDGTPMSDEDITSALRNWTAGQGTVAAGLSIVALHLAEDQDLQRRLRDEPGLLPTAIYEVLRADGPLVANRRTTTRPVEIGGRHIASGEKLTLMWIAADRDPDVFCDPDAIRPDRDETGNLLFGAGIHDCLGAPLARLELRVALEELLAATSRIEIGDEPPLRAVYPSNGLRALPLRFL